MHLTDYHMVFGDWREIFRYLERLEKVTKADIRRVASETFRAPNRVVAMIETASTPPPGFTRRSQDKS